MHAYTTVSCTGKDDLPDHMPITEIVIRTTNRYKPNTPNKYRWKVLQSMILLLMVTTSDTRANAANYSVKWRDYFVNVKIK